MDGGVEEQVDQRSKSRRLFGSNLRRKGNALRRSERRDRGTGPVENALRDCGRSVGKTFPANAARDFHVVYQAGPGRHGGSTMALRGLRERNRTNRCGEETGGGGRQVEARISS